MTSIRFQAAVIDASVGVKLFIQEEDSQIVDELFAQLVSDPPASFYVPDLFYIECANVLWKYAHQFNYSSEHAQRDLTALLALALYTIPSSTILNEAMRLALQVNISVYDACYAALAHKLDLPLITADQKLVQKLQLSEIEAVLISCA